MEHSILHALELSGQIVALGGVLLVLGLLRPASRALGPDPDNDKLARPLAASAARWVFRGALAGALATFLNLFVEVGEVQGKTVFSGVSLAYAATFALKTMVGRLSLARIAALILTAGIIRWSGRCKWWLAGASAFSAIVLTSMVSHAAAQPTGRFAEMVAQVTHITAVAAWVGILIHLLAARPWIQSSTGQAGIGLVAEMVRRFSPLALATTSLLALSGLFMVTRFLVETGALLTSAYGLTLIVKLLLLLPAIVAGGINYRIIRPRLLAQAGFLRVSTAGTAGAQHSPGSLNTVPASFRENEAAALKGVVAAGEIKTSSNLLQRFGRMLELEVTAGLLVIAAAGILASVSPPGEGGAYRLTERQARAMVSPHLPAKTIPDPANFYGAPKRTLEDLHYSEFMHNWSGVMVCLLGLGWLTQCAGGRAGKWAGIVWPLLLIPFAAFLAVFSDPETWWLRRIGLKEVLGDPQLLEHELGKLMLFGVVWLGFRDRRKRDTIRPLGYALPVMLMLAGFLLLGHAHSTLSATEQLTNLINVQHAIFGAFMVLAGTVRWLSLRHLFPSRIADLLWPTLIIGLGMFMAFYYCEAV